MEKISKKNGSKDKFAYFIEDKSFGKLYVKKSGNAWWLDRGKVERLITGFKMDCKPQECRLLAGITKDQLDYFKKMHPEFSAILDDVRKMPSIKARQTIIRALENDPRAAMWYLERKEADEFREKKQIESTGDLPILVQDIWPINDDMKKQINENASQKETRSIMNDENKEKEDARPDKYDTDNNKEFVNYAEDEDINKEDMSWMSM
jgi:hypothetical protein